MSSVEKDSIVLDDKKEAVVMTPFSENKSLTKDVDKGTEELEYMNEEVVTIRTKDSDNFQVQSKVYTG